MKELAKRFDFKTVDEKWNQYWVENHTFHADRNSGKPPFVIVIPPPNVTGILHMGHALNNTLQDIIIRYKRMNGFETLWMPGTDHAGIATQNVVEKQLAKEGKTRHDIGREALLERLWDWKKQYGDTIIHQLKKMGASCDWDRTRFTMDDDYSDAVKKVFIELYKKDLVYQGKYIINWCPRCHTALSDEEAEHKETTGKLYHIKYPFVDNPNEFLTVATTRPETMLGDTAVAVNPEDERYKHLIGKKLLLPIMNREIPVIADDFVGIEFGTGAVKVTPAHDPNDFAMGKRHHLENIQIMNEDGTINKNGGEFAGLDRFKARKEVIKKLDELGFFIKDEEHHHGVGHCYRCDTVVEPYLSKQWFVKMEPLAKEAIEVVTNGKVTFSPDRWTKVYMNWMENIRDWCISRQIWWGHRIPVWYDEDGNQFVAYNEAEAKEQAKAKHGKDVELKQDPDVLDTWFSSWLWPFATLGWPQSEDDVKYFYPGNALFTASEIIFFWVARMIMAGLEFRNDIPFDQVYIHGTVRDTQGRKMSKSLGNAIDPLEIIDEYGADALRFSLIINSGQDLYISKDKFEIGRNFANKLWNASRFILMNLKVKSSNHTYQELIEQSPLPLPSQWIVSQLQQTVITVSESIEKFRYSEAESAIYDFVWSNFCDWYLEIIKDHWDNETIQELTLKILMDTLKITHPFMPFVTEEIWENIGSGDKCLSLEEWVKVDETLINSSSSKTMNTIIELVTAIRNVRAQWNISPKEQLALIVEEKEGNKSLIDQNASFIQKLGRLEKITLKENVSSEKNVANIVLEDLTAIIPLGNIIDLDAEQNRLNKQLDELNNNFEKLSKRLENKGFIAKAPAEVVEKDRQRLQDFKSQINELKTILKNFS